MRSSPELSHVPRVPRPRQVQSGYRLPLRQLRLDGAKLRLFSFPGGNQDPARTVVCVPGLAASGRSFAPLASLAPRLRLLLWTPPFHTPMGSTPTDHNVRLLSHPEAPLPPRFALLASSYGTLIALAFALHFPSRVSGLVLVSPVASPRGIRVGTALAATLLRSPLPLAYAFAPAAARVLGGRRLPPEGRAEIVREARRLGPVEMARRLRDILAARLAGRLAEVRAPTLVVHGGRDVVLPLVAARDVAMRIPDARLEVIPGAAHLPYMSHPERFNPIVGPFLERAVA